MRGMGGRSLRDDNKNGNSDGKSKGNSFNAEGAEEKRAEVAESCG